jgi:oxaloacetate decarboxylase (Na+ extruding) subunit gamma
MTPNNLLMEGVEIMFFGMGFVLAFLTLLIFTIRGMSMLITRFAPEPLPPVSTPRPAPLASPPISADLLTAIQTAVHQHRAKQR